MVKQISLFKRIDTCIDSFFGINRQTLSRDESLQYAYASLKNLIVVSRKKHPENSYYKILCSGFSDAKEVSSIVSVFIENQSSLSELVKFELIAAENVLNSAAAMTQLSQCDAVVLFEKIKSTHYTQVQKEIALIDTMGKEIIGVILIE